MRPGHATRYGIALHLMIALLSGCAASDGPLVPGSNKREDDVSTVDMEISVDGLSQIFVGDGINTVTRQIHRPSCLAGDRTQINVRKLTAQGRVRLFSTTRALEEEMKLGVGIGGGYWGASASAKLAAFTAVSKSEQNLYLEFEGWSTAAKTIWANATLTDDARRDAQREDLFTFLNACGNDFVAYTEEATYIVGIFVKTERNATKRAELATSLSAGFNAGAATATAELTDEQRTRLSNTFSSATLAYSAKGWTPTFPSGMSFDNALATVSSMDPTAAGNGVPYKVRVSPYDQRFGGSFCVPPNGTPRPTPSLARLKTFIDRMDGYIQNLQRGIALMDYMNTHRGQFTRWPLPAFDPAQTEQIIDGVGRPSFTDVAERKTAFQNFLTQVQGFRTTCIQSAQYASCGEPTAGGPDQPAGRPTAAQQAVLNNIETAFNNFRDNKPRWVTAAEPKALGGTRTAAEASAQCAAYRVFGYNGADGKPLGWTLPTYDNGRAVVYFAYEETFDVVFLLRFWVSDNPGYPPGSTPRGALIRLKDFPPKLEKLRHYVDAQNRLVPGGMEFAAVVCVPSTGPLGPPPSLDLSPVFGTRFNPL